MYKLNHPHVIRLINHFEDDEKFYLIMPYASKGQLYSLLRRQVRFDQRTAAQYMREVLEAVRYIHSFSPKIIHRDIKPENLLLDENYRVLLSDFGWSNFLDENEYRKTFCGTPEYLSPEMAKKSGHNEMVDIWALGVLLFEFLAGYAPFSGSCPKELYTNIKKLKVNWPVDFPPLAKNLVSKILKLNPSERLSVEEILDHPWFTQNPPLRHVLTNYLTDEKEILKSHLVIATPESVEDKINDITDPHKKRKFGTLKIKSNDDEDSSDSNHNINNNSEENNINNENNKEDKKEINDNKIIEEQKNEKINNNNVIGNAHNEINNEDIEEKNLKIKTNEINNKKENSEIIINNIENEREEIKNIRKEKNEIYIKKNKIKDEKKEQKKDDKGIENKKENENKNEDKYENKEENNRSKEVYKRKNRIRKKEEKEKYDEEDLKMQNLLINEFPKKCKEENRFIRITKYEYAFGEEKIKVELGKDDVILKLDEGDYKLNEFIDILNEGKEEEEQKEENKNENNNINKNLDKKEVIYEEEKEEEEELENDNKNNEIFDKKNSNKKNVLYESCEKKGKRKRRKKRVSEENSDEEEEENEENENGNEDINYNENKRKERKYVNEEEYEKENEDIESYDNDKNDDDINNSDNKDNKYIIKRRKDYLFKK